MPQILGLRVVYRTLASLAVAAGLVGMAVARRHALHHAATREWMRQSSSSVQLASSLARAWAGEREAGARILGASAAREPALFEGPAALYPPVTAAALSQRLARALTQLNQASSTSGKAFSDLWLINRSGVLVTSASTRVPPAVIGATVLTAAGADSLIVVGPFPSRENQLGVIFIQPVEAQVDARGTATGSLSVVGAVVLASTVDATLLRTLGVAPPGLSGEPTSLIVQVRDSVYEYAFLQRTRGFRVRSWDALKTPALERAALNRMGSVPALGDSTTAVVAQIGGLPWGLVRRANPATLFVAADAEFVREISTAILILTVLSWLVFARGHRERSRHLRGLAASEARYRLLADHSTDIIARYAPDGRVLYVSPAVNAVLGYAPRAVVGSYPFALRHDDDAETMHTAIHRAFSLNEAVRTEHRFRHADGHFVWLETVGRALRDPATGEVKELITTSRDIADAKAAEAALRASEEQYRLLFETNPMPMWTFDAETGRFLAVNNAAVTHYGYSRDEFLKMTIFDVRPQEHAAEARSIGDRVGAGVSNFPSRHHRTKDGTVILVDLTVHPVRFAGRPARLVLINDVTEKKEIEAAFRESSQFIRAILDSSPVAIVAADFHMRVVQWNRAAEQLFGWGADEVVGERCPLMADRATRSTVARLREELLRAGHLTGREAELARKDGTRVKVDLSLAAIHNATGELAGFVGLAVDLTERTRLEAQLRQAQKMEAVGQLAGGIAHDFNNLLTVITTYTDLLIAGLPETAPARADLVEIKGAGERAAALTRQLLAFSRRQLLEPRLVDLNVVVHEMEQMLRRVLLPAIHLVTSLDPALGAVYADTGQIEQVLMNLIVNARDAMPLGGTLTIVTTNVELQPDGGTMGPDAGPPPDVMLTVSDTGCGMSREIQDHIFEPFFTTKGVGKGTGLGLSTAHGIMSQSGGHLDVRSEPGIGTTFTMYLPGAPAAAGDAAAALQERPSSSGQLGTEVVLLVEDEAAVRTVARRILERAGYTVLVAADGPEALSLHAQHAASIDVVITDMVMPTMSGAAVAAALRAHHPHLPVVLMSGLADDAMACGVEGDPVVILCKPFTPDALTRKVSEALRSSQISRASPVSEMV